MKLKKFNIKNVKKINFQKISLVINKYLNEFYIIIKHRLIRQDLD